MVRFHVWALVISMTLAGAGMESIAREPAGEFAPEIRTVSTTPDGETTRVVLELSAVLPADSATLRIVARSDDPTARPFDERHLGRERPGASLRTRYELELSSGRLHHLFFEIRRGDADDGDPGEVVYHRVNLDPSLEPTDRGRVLEFRARPGTETGP